MTRCKLTVIAALLFACPSFAAIPTFFGNGTIKNSINAISNVAYPASVAIDDVCFLLVEHSDGTTTLDDEGGQTWTEHPDSPVTRGNEILTIFHVRLTSASPGLVDINDSGNHQIAQITCFRGVITSGLPWDVTGSNTNASQTTFNALGSTTTVIDTLVFVLCGISLPDSNSTSACSSESNSDLGSLTERNDQTKNSGDGGGFCAYTGTKAAIGTYGATTATLGTSAEQACFNIALKPPVAGAGRRRMF